MSRSIVLYLVVGLLAATAGAFVASWFQKDPNEGSAGTGPRALLGEQRPDFTLGASDGRRVSAADFDGQVLLINFWATWCAPCRKEMPMLNALQKEFAEDGVEIVGIALDDVKRARDFAKSLDIDYTILVGAGDVMAMGLAYGNRDGLLPYTVLVDRSGTVRWTFLGELKEPELREQIEPLL